MAGCFNPNSMEEFMVSADASLRRYETNFDRICSKYGQSFPDDDIVSMKTGQIVNDKGTIRNLKPVSFGGSKLAVTKRRADKFAKALSNSTMDMSQNQSVDGQSIYSNYVSGRANVSHFADDASKLLSFICEDEKEPSDAETISSRDTSSLDAEREDRLTDLESCSDEVDGDLDLCSPRAEYPCKLKQDVSSFNDNVWYSLGSNQSPSSGSDLSVRKHFGSLNSQSQEISSKAEDSIGTGDLKGACGSLSKSNMVRFDMEKGLPEDSGFESGPGIRMGADKMVGKGPLRMFCLNEDKINRVMNWVKDQANENRHPGAPIQPVTLRNLLESTQPNKTDDVLLKSPSKIRKKSDKDHNFNNRSSPQHPQLYPITRPVGDMNTTYTVPLPSGDNSNRMPFSPVDRGSYNQPELPTCNQHKTWVVDAGSGPVVSSKPTNTDRKNDSSELLGTSQDLTTDAMCQRRIVRARKRAFIPIQPAYTSEQLFDYLTSPVPKTVVEILSPARPSRVQAEEDTLPCLKSPPPSLLRPRADVWEESQLQGSPSHHHHSHMNWLSKEENYIGRAVGNNGHYPMNNLNQDDTTDNSGCYDDDVVITKVKLEPGLEQAVASSPREHTQHREHAGCDMRNQCWLKDRVSEKDDSVTLCEGFGYSVPEHGHIMSPVPQAITALNIGRNRGTPTTPEHRDDRIIGTPNGTPNAAVGYIYNQNLGAPMPFNSQDNSKHCGGTPDALSVKSSHVDNRNMNGTPQTCFSAGSRNKKQIFDHLKQTGSQSDSKVVTENVLSRGHVKARRQLTMEQTGRGTQMFLSEGGLMLDNEQLSAKSRKSQLQSNFGRNNREKFSVDRNSYETSSKVPAGNRQADESGEHLTSVGEGRVEKNYQVRCSAPRGRNIVLRQNGNQQETVGHHQRRSNQMDETPASPGRKVDAGICRNPKVSSRKYQSDDLVLSPLRNSRCSSVSSQGLSPSSHLSQLQLNSPTQVKIERMKLNKTSSKELFKTPKGSPRSKCAKHPSQITNDLSSKTTQQCKDFSQNFYNSKSKNPTDDKSNLMSHKSSSYNDLSKSSRNHISSRSPSKSDSDNLRRSMPQLPTSPPLSPADKQKTSSNEYLVSKENFKKSPYSKTKCSKDLQKPVFLVPDSSCIRSLKSVKSSKSMTSESNSWTVKTGLKKISRDQFRSVYRSTDKNPLWTSTPAKARNMPVLNQTMSTILLGEDDDGASDEANDDDEVETVSPYSFRSDSINGM
ncbi:uncharacterized protein LOC124272724 [Haliotis rubra]|uniref:uncharacterized protein LOC124272724 n=1 Tax=Haliotis rubra TaxID=36100 RepID=UPI001EE5C694|nr:uncharacterized protein LOC124272724 [Haliotis rubra]